MPTPAIIGSAPTSAGPTQRRLRRRLADELGSWQEVTVSATATNPESTRTLIVNELRDDEVGTSHLFDAWAYVRTLAQAGTQRRILAQDEAGWQGAIGVLTTSRPFDAAVTVGAVLEITDPLPVKRHVGRNGRSVKGLNDLVNEGLALCRTTARIALTGNGTDTHDLGALYPFITDEAQILGLYDTRWLASGTSPALSPYGARLVRNGVTHTLVTDYAYSTSETFYLDVIVPADLLVYDGAAWAFVTTPGLQGDAWQAAVPEHWALAFGMTKALEYLSRLTLARSDLAADEKKLLLADLLDRRRKWSKAAWLIQQREFPRPTQERTTPAFGMPIASEWN